MMREHPGEHKENPPFIPLYKRGKEGDLILCIESTARVPHCATRANACRAAWHLPLSGNRLA